MTPFAALLAASGLSQREAAVRLGVKEDTVNDWVRGRKYRGAPPAALDAMASLVRQVLNAVDAARGQVRELEAQYGAPEWIDIACSRTDEEAQTHGWACRSHELAACGLILAAIPRARLVLRASTPATAAAADAHELSGKP